MRTASCKGSENVEQLWETQHVNDSRAGGGQVAARHKRDAYAT